MSELFHGAGEMMPTLTFWGRAFLFLFTSAILLISVLMLSGSENKDAQCRERLNLAHYSGLLMAIFAVSAFLTEAEMFAHNGANPYCLFKGFLYILLWGILYFALLFLCRSDSDWHAIIGLVWIILAFVAVIVAALVGRGRYNALKVEQIENTQTYTYLAMTKNEDGDYTLLLDVGSDGTILVYATDRDGNLKPLAFPASKLEFRNSSYATNAARLVESDIVERRYIPYNDFREPVDKKVGVKTYIEVKDYGQIASSHQRFVLGPDYPIDNIVFGPPAPNR